jgi:hypothetical protein
MATVVAGKYELLEVLRDAGIRTFRARQVTLGHVLMVHFIPGSQRGDDFALLDRLAQLPDSARKLFFDAGEHDSVPYVVSWPLPEFTSLPEWLDRTIEKNRRQSRSAATAPKTQPSDSSEFTRLFFRDMKEPAAGGAGDLVTGQSHAAPKVKEPPLPPKEPGEFTKFFRTPAKVEGPAKPLSEPMPPPPKAAPAPPISSSPGEFTQFFRGAPAEAHPAKPESELFAPAPSFPPADDLAVRSPAMGRVVPPSSPPPLPKPPSLVESPIQAPDAGISAVPRAPAAPVSPEPIVADDYAKVIARPPAPPLPPPPPLAPRKPAVAPPPIPQVQRPPSSAYLPMWITLAVLFVIAVALTLLLALSR